VFIFVEENERESSLSALANGAIKAFGNVDLPLGSYSQELLFSPVARTTYVQPDLQDVLAYYV